MLTEDQFLAYVAQYIEENPLVAPRVTDFVTMGLKNALDKSLERAADMEVALAVSLERKNKFHGDLIREKLMKWKGKTSLCWENLLKEKD